MIKEKMKQILKLPLLVMVSMLALLPTVIAYPITYPAYDLYQVFVEIIFGSVLLSIFGLAFVMWVIMTLLGRMSAFTTLSFGVIFIFTMGIAIKSPLTLIVPIFAGAIYFAIAQFQKWVNSSSSI